MFKTIAEIALIVSLIVTVLLYYSGLDWQWEAFWTLLLAITIQDIQE